MTSQYRGAVDVIVPENVTTAVDTYEAVRAPAGTTPMWVLEGDDEGDFSISVSGVLTFLETPDYENPADEDTDNVYEVAVEGSAGSASDVIRVFITVTNEEEKGTLTLDNRDMPRVGTAVTANLDDPDHVVDVIWEWTKSREEGFWTTIASSASAVYTPVEADLGWLLRASARYIDEQSSTIWILRADTGQPVGPPAPAFPENGGWC